MCVVMSIMVHHNCCTALLVLPVGKVHHQTCMVKKRTTYLTTTMSVSVHKTRDRAPTTSSSEGELLKMDGQRYSGDVPVRTVVTSDVSSFTESMVAILLTGGLQLVYLLSELSIRFVTSGLFCRVWKCLSHCKALIYAQTQAFKNFSGVIDCCALFAAKCAYPGHRRPLQRIL